MAKFIIVVLFILLVFKTNAQNNEMHYDLKYHRFMLNLDPNVEYIKGSVCSYFTILSEKKNTIAFDFNNAFMVDSVIQDNDKLNYLHTNDILKIDLKRFGYNKLDSITIYYQGKPESTGIGSIVYSDHLGVPIMWTLSEPFGAKDWWPCKQSLQDKIDSVDIFVNTAIDYKVASNGVLQYEKVTDNKKRVYWKSRYPVAYYLIAVAITNYTEYSDFVDTDSGNIEVLNYVYPESLLSAKANTKNIIPVFKLFNDKIFPYPFKNEKYGHAQFNWGGGMEHQTMSFMVNFSTDLMTHELAHQWFGNYITCASWNDIWINEGFAVFMEGLAAEHNVYNMSWKRFKRNKIRRITSESDGSVYVYDTTSIRRIFDSRLTYDKGGMILHQLRGQIGDQAFFNGLKAYLNDPELAYKCASSEDFIRHLEKTSNKSLQYYFDAWLYGEGYPKYTLKWYQSKDKLLDIEIIQKQTHHSVSFFKLNLPVRIIGTNNEIKDIWLEHNYSGENFIIDIDFKVKKIIFDPESWIITRNPKIIKLLPKNQNVTINLSPNPVDSVLIVEVNGFVPEYVYIYDANGLLIKAEKIKKTINPISISVDELNKGIYILYLKSNNNLAKAKFIKL